MTPTTFVFVPPTAVRARQVAGLTLLGRAVRVATAASQTARTQHGVGAPRQAPRDALADVHVVYRDDSEQRAASLEAREAPPMPIGEALAARASGDERPFLLLFGEVVIDRRVVDALAAEPIAPDEIVGVETDTGPGHVYLVGPDVGSVLAPSNLASREAFESWASPRSVRLLTPRLDTPSFAYVVQDAASEQAAVHALFQACIKPIDGIVSRNVNRRLSIPLSRMLANTAITPNQITSLCLLVAVVAALVALRGDFVSLAIAGTLFQLNSVLDGVDGELARVKWAFTKFGEFLDSIGDDLSNFAYFGALVYVANAHGQRALGIAGGIGLVLWAGYLVFLYFSLRGTDRGDVMIVSQQAMSESKGFWHRAIEVARLLMRRDGFVFLAFLLALVGRATYILPVVLVGGASTFVFAMRETLRRATVR